jgi:RNA exonuclease 4
MLCHLQFNIRSTESYPGFSRQGDGSYYYHNNSSIGNGNNRDNPWDNHGSVTSTTSFPSSAAKSLEDDDQDTYHSSSQNNNSSTAKKRSRRRRKGKSRTKVEPLTPCGRKGGIASPAHCTVTSSNSKKQHDAPMKKRDLYFALDCEMVGVGQDGMASAVGRVSIVNWENQVVLDTYVLVPAPVTDFRTHISGITPEHLQARPGHTLMTFAQVRETVQNILRGKILIGHGLENDLKALGLYHPWTDIRDTATYSYYMRQYRDPVTQGVAYVPKKLRDLAWEVLGRQIQMPGVPHSPTEDAIAALDLYKEVRGQWEDHLIRVAQQKDEEQQRQLMELSQQQQQEQMEQMRRCEWLGSPNQPTIYPGQVMVHPTPMPSPQSYGYPTSPTVVSPMMMMTMMPPDSPAAAVFLQGPVTTPPPQQPPIRSSGSSWFGFSRRPKPRTTRQAISSVMSHDSITTQYTMTTVQSSFSQDQFGLSTPGGSWHIREDFAAEQQGESQDISSADAYRMAREYSQEAILWEEPVMSEVASTMAVDPEDGNCSETQTTSMSFTESLHEDDCCSETKAPPLPTDYEPPRYFANPDPEPMSSSSWFKLWRSNNKDRSQDARSSKGDESDTEPEEEERKPRRSSDTARASSPSYSLFSGRLFPRRNSESCMEDMVEREWDEHSKSLH